MIAHTNSYLMIPDSWLHKVAKTREVGNDGLVTPPLVLSLFTLYCRSSLLVKKIQTMKLYFILAMFPTMLTLIRHVGITMFPFEQQILLANHIIFNKSTKVFGLHWRHGALQRRNRFPCLLRSRKGSRKVVFPLPFLVLNNTVFP